MMEKNHRGCAHYRRADQQPVSRVALKVLPSAIVFFQQVFGMLEVHVDVEILFEFRLDVRHLLNQRKFIDRLSVVSNRP